MRGWKGEKWMKLCSERALIFHCCRKKSYSEPKYILYAHRNWIGEGLKSCISAEGADPAAFPQIRGNMFLQGHQEFSNCFLYTDSREPAELQELDQGNP